MLAQIADFHLCALMSLRPYVPANLCPCALMSAPLCPARFCLRPYDVGFRHLSTNTRVYTVPFYA